MNPHKFAHIYDFFLGILLGSSHTGTLTIIRQMTGLYTIKLQNFFSDVRTSGGARNRSMGGLNNQWQKNLSGGKLINDIKDIIRNANENINLK